MGLDIVYVCRHGEDNEELRYSLRSLANLPHDRVWIAGGCPSWVQGVNRIPVAPMRHKHDHALASLVAALNHPDVSDPFLMFNDDFYVMRPMERMPVLHEGPLQEVIEAHAKGSAYRNAMEKTASLLDADALGYEIHAPMEMDKLGMLLVLSLGQGIKGFQYRTAYGNLERLGGTQCSDVKVYRSDRGKPYKEWALLSTSDRTFKYHPVGKYIRESFPEPSPYERPMPKAIEGPRSAIRYAGRPYVISTRK